MGQVAQTRDDSDCPEEQEQAGEPGENMPNKEGDTAATKPQAETGITGTRPPAGGVHRLGFMENFAAAEGDTTC